MKPYEEHYHGARFFKCDLQMQTPADRKHWRGAPMGDSDEDKRAAAEAYIQRCYSVGLEVIGITDHNFASQAFIPLLREAILAQKKEHGYEIVLFPGFEFTADVGKGVHVLALFDPAMGLDAIDHVLTQCGVPYPRFQNGEPQKSTKRLPELLAIIQERTSEGALQGLVVLPHVQSEKGIFDTERTAGWLQAEEFTNPNLLCIEVPKPSNQMSAGWQKLLRSGPDCDKIWRRTRPVACILSSDAKALTPDAGAENYIGFRHTWIKMSRPSIEALRQAFLDPDSRIRFSDERPEEAYTFPKIRSLSVQGANFLADEDIAFSANLTTLIGGRGTGKSTFVEYLRIVSGQDTAVQGEDARKNFQRLRPSIGSGVLVAKIEKEGQALEVTSRAAGPSIITEGPSAPDLARFFPVKVLSQKEIYAIAEDRGARLRLVDDMVRRDLDELGRREMDLVGEIQSLNRQIASLHELRRRERELETEYKDFEVKLSRLTTLEEPLTRWKGRLAEERFFTDLPAEASNIARSVREALHDVELRVTAIGDELAKSPDAELVKQVADAADSLTQQLREASAKAVALFEEGIGALLRQPDVQQWHQDIALARSAFEQLRHALQAQGTNPDQYLDYQRGLRERMVQLTEVKRRIASIDAIRIERDGGDAGGAPVCGRLDDLWKVWVQQAQCRISAAHKLAEGVPKTEKGNPFVTVTVTPFGDEQAFVEKMREALRDRRRMADDDWDIFMYAVHKASRVAGRGVALHGEGSIPHESTDAPGSPTTTLGQWVRTLRQGATPAGCPWAQSDRRLQVLLEWLTEGVLDDLGLWRTPDRVCIELFRQDGSSVGNLDGPVSVGQRCTAILALLLASGDTPIVIDQPEEDLDNEFVFRELVPLLRQVKERRQIILATHNANIPVNADAELVVAMDVRDGRGALMNVDGQTACGALDRPAVKRAVENIMEGSEEAFRCRLEKYGF